MHRCKHARLELLEKLGGSWDAGVDKTSTLTEDEQVLLSATLVNRDTERQAAQAFEGSEESLPDLACMEWTLKPKKNHAIKCSTFCTDQSNIKGVQPK